MVKSTKYHPVWDVYDLYRTARLNIKYYSHLLTHWKRLNTWLECSLLIFAPSSAIAGIFFWQTPCGAIVWKWLIVITAVIASIKPIIRITGDL